MTYKQHIENLRKERVHALGAHYKAEDEPRWRTKCASSRYNRGPTATEKATTK